MCRVVCTEVCRVVCTEFAWLAVVWWAAVELEEAVELRAGSPMAAREGMRMVRES